MSYSTISTNVADVAFQNRVNASVAQENREGSNQPDRIMWQMIWKICSASDIEAAYASALAADNPNPGGDEAVITDGMILANVQAHWPPDETP